MSHLLAFGASTSTHSINRQLAKYAAEAVPGASVNLIDLNNYPAPIYSVNQEAAQGIPAAVKSFVEAIESADGIVVSLAEHNGSYAAAFKSLFDWATRHKQKVWSDKPMFLLSTSPGGRGGATVLAAAESSFPRLGARVVATFSLPSFQDNFSPESGIQDASLKKEFAQAVARFTAGL
jgi:NAD(P)H-dependent FMN reductase